MRRAPLAIILILALAAAAAVALLPSADQQGDIDVGRLGVESEATGRSLEIAVASPAGPATNRGLLVFLHGQGGSPGEFTTNGSLLESLRQLGERAPAIAFPTGGEHGYWHDRREADWESWVLDEVIPLAARRLGTEPDRVATGGISMGGFGAYSIALAAPRRFCAVGGHSAAIWPRFEETFEGAFDAPGDFARQDLLARVADEDDPFAGIPVWNDYGEDDWFVAGNERFVELLRAGRTDLTAHVWPGGHDGAYWNSHWDEYLGFYARALARCEVGERLR